ncbi:hypothetical protein B566_EDAN007372 [Ephemera danica]|nr:hypothetical protein B566_EDAN007372 [Ephemera danica]
MSDAWEEIQAIKSKRISLREKLQKRKKERQELLSSSVAPLASGTGKFQENYGLRSIQIDSSLDAFNQVPSPLTKTKALLSEGKEAKPDPGVEAELLRTLCDVALTLPVTGPQLTATISKVLGKTIAAISINNLLQKFATQQLISVKEIKYEGQEVLEVISSEHAKLVAMANELHASEPSSSGSSKRKSQAGEAAENAEPARKALCPEREEKKKDQKDPRDNDILSLLSMPSTREKESKKMGEEILDLLSKPTAKERSMAERFRSQGGAQVIGFCPHGTKLECAKVSSNQPCKKLHFKKILQKHTDESLGDCSFLNTCFHMDTCKYVHYEVDGAVAQTRDSLGETSGESSLVPGQSREAATTLYPAQWVQCDLRYLDMNVLGKFAVIMADPPWDIHMELPYGTMSDDEMRQLGIPTLQDDGLIFLWVTGRAMELGRECLKLWGYERVDEIIWVKTNQLQRIIRTGRTGHWLNHGKEHCLVGMKGNPAALNRGLDCDVIVAEVRATSHKPDEIYGIIERLSPGTRKIELFGRPHNVQPNWITLGNQVNGVKLVDPDLKKAFQKRYPDGNCMGPPKT